MSEGWWMGTGRWMVLLGEDDTMDQTNGFSSAQVRK